MLACDTILLVVLAMLFEPEFSAVCSANVLEKFPIKIRFDENADNTLFHYGLHLNLLFSRNVNVYTSKEQKQVE